MAADPERTREYMRRYYLEHNGKHRTRMVPAASKKEKKCASCGEIKERAEFTERKTGPKTGHMVPSCKKCAAKKSRARKRADGSIYKRIERKSKIKLAYGITSEDYDRMLEEQGGRCAICLTHDPTDGRPDREFFAIDHNHETGKVRGLLCSRCNMAIGLIKDSTANAFRMAEYLLKE